MDRKNKTLILLIFAVFIISSLAGCSTTKEQPIQNEQPKTEAQNEKKDPIIIKLAHENVPKHPMGEGFIKFKELVESRSNGEIKVDLYDSGKFGGGREIVEGLQSGMIQMGSSSTPNLQPFSNAFLLFDMPFLFPDYESTDKVTDGPIGQEMAKALESTGVKGLGYIEIGFRNIYNNNKPVKTMEDMEGLKIRATASKAHIATLQTFGANATPVAWGEVYTALQQKTVDGIDIDLNLAWFNNFHEVQKYLTIVNSIYSPHLVLINKAFYEKLSPEHQKIIDESFNEIKLFERNLIRENEKMIMEKYKETGIEITVLTPEERQKWADECSSIIEEYEETIGKDILEQVRELVKK